MTRKTKGCAVSADCPHDERGLCRHSEVRIAEEEDAEREADNVFIWEHADDDS